MSAPEFKERRPDRAALVIAAALAVFSAVILWQTKAMPVTAQYARVGPTTMPYLMSGFLAVLAGMVLTYLMLVEVVKRRLAHHDGG